MHPMSRRSQNPDAAAGTLTVSAILDPDEHHEHPLMVIHGQQEDAETAAEHGPGRVLTLTPEAAALLAFKILRCPEVWAYGGADHYLNAWLAACDKGQLAAIEREVAEARKTR